MYQAYASIAPMLQPCEPPYSFYHSLVRSIWKGKNPAPLHRLCNLMRKIKAQCFVQEELEIAAEIEEERAAAQLRCGGAVSASAVRLTFFKQIPASKKWEDTEERHLLAYAVIVVLTLPDFTQRTYMLESVVCPPTLWFTNNNGLLSPHSLTNHYIHCAKEFETTIGTKASARTLKLHGTFFCQQNNLTHVCAHSSLRIAINSSPLYVAQKLTAQQINNMLAIDLTKRCMGWYSTDPSTTPPADRGLIIDEMTHIITQLGFDTHRHNYTTMKSSYADVVYPYVESGFPVIAIIHGGREAHAVAILGHTANSDRWTPEARTDYGGGLYVRPYIPAACWTDHFVISDDNYGMYGTVSTDHLRHVPPPTVPGSAPVPAPENPAQSGSLYMRSSLAICPSGMKNVAAHAAEQLVSYLAHALTHVTPTQTDNRWFESLKDYPRVCRTIYQTKIQYLDFMRNVADIDGRKLTGREIKILEGLSDKFWVTEITMPHILTANKRKLGDIIIRTDVAPPGRDPKDLIPFLPAVELIWLPGLFWYGAGLKGVADSKNWPGLKQDWPLKAHIPLIRGAGRFDPDLEW